MSNNVYIVESPTQLMSAIEAKTANPGKHFLIVDYGSCSRLENKKQIKQLVDDNTWDDIFKIKQLTNKWFNLLFTLYYCIRLKFRFYRTEANVYVGEYRNYLFCILARIITQKREILLDDGAVTIMLQQRFFSSGKGLRSYYHNTKAFNRLLIYSYIFAFDFDDSPPNLFSTFNLDKWLYVGQENHRNKDIPVTVEVLNYFYFFGAKYSEAGLLDFKVEIALLKRAFDYSYEKYRKPILYIAHRDDSIEKLEAITDLGIEVKRLGMPCELYFKIHQCIPKYIGGFYTTSLISLPNLFRIGRVLSFDLTSYLMTEASKQNIECIYDYLSTNGCDVIKI